MSLNERIKEARLRSGLTQEQLGKLIGVAKTTVAGYEKNREPDAATLGALMESLKVDANFLFQDEMNALRAEDFTVPEIKHIQKYRTLDEYGKRAVDSILEIAYQRCTELSSGASEETILTVPFRCSVQPASAGTGAYLGPEEFDTILVKPNPLIQSGSFGVPVSGDSMEPVYHDGDILVVAGGKEVKPGEVGVFTVGGMGYVKKFGVTELISINPEYDPIAMSEGVICNGKVIGVLEPEWIVK